MPERKQAGTGGDGRMHPVHRMIQKRNMGIRCAMPSYCSANELVLEAVMDEACRYDDVVLIEATANQVNQYGGYTGMQAADFREYVFAIADRTGFDKDRIILGGDHLGPLAWRNEPVREAMDKAAALVKSYVKAGFTKIHLDTSMKLGDEAREIDLPAEIIAERGAALLLQCSEAYSELLSKNPHSPKPVYVIGSEVPIPGGGQEPGEKLRVTTADDLENTLNSYAAAFKKYGIKDAWKQIAAVVVQPGIEFSDSGVCMYDRVKTYELSQALKKYPNLVLEGHSTDYQGAKLLREMAEDGVGILKVGPALTFALREALFSLHRLEKELIANNKKDSGFIHILERTMLLKADNWRKHYHGNEQELSLARKYSYSDRCRYYLGEKEVKASIDILFRNLEEIDIPLNMICQYMPLQYKKVRDGILKNNARALAKDAIINVIYDYEYAAKENFAVEYR